LEVDVYCQCGNEIHDGDEMCQECRDSTEKLAREMGCDIDNNFDDMWEQPMTDDDYQCQDAHNWHQECRDMRVQM
jgi:hypothetical protein